MKQKKHTKTEIAAYTAIAALIFLAIYILPSAVSYNYEYVNVTTQVNITNSYPYILSVIVDDGSGNITLNAGDTYNVHCNVSARDYGGYQDIDTVNITFFHSSVGSNDPDANSTHYSNSSCTQVSADGFDANYTCSVDAYYYANRGFWTCNVTVTDQAGVSVYDDNTTYIDPLLALNVTPVIDFENMTVETYSNNITANITNIGNENINVSLYGYGGTNPAFNDTAMICQVGNISIEYERYSLSPQPWAGKTPLSGIDTAMGLTMPKQSSNSIVQNTTYWQLFIPPNPFGLCNGTIVFSAGAS